MVASETHTCLRRAQFRRDLAHAFGLGVGGRAPLEHVRAGGDDRDGGRGRKHEVERQAVGGVARGNALSGPSGGGMFDCRENDMV